MPRTPDLPHATHSTVSAERLVSTAQRAEEAIGRGTVRRKRRRRGTGPVEYFPLKSETGAQATSGMQMPRLRRITSRAAEATDVPWCRWKSQGAAEQYTHGELSFVRGASYSGGKSSLVAVEQIYG